MNAKNILEALEWRRAIGIFDPKEKISDEDLKTILKAGNLAPSSFGTEPWKFLVITNSELRKKLRAVGYDQPKITDASHLIVIARRTDVENIVPSLVERTAKIHGKAQEELEGLRQMVGGAIQARGEGVDHWLASQTYIALGIMMETASLLHIDNAAMEGFDPHGVNEALGLKQKNLFAVTMLALGKRAHDDPVSARAKVRRDFNDAVEVL